MSGMSAIFLSLIAAVLALAVTRSWIIAAAVLVIPVITHMIVWTIADNRFHREQDAS